MRWTFTLAALLVAICFASPALAGGTTTYPKNCLDWIMNGGATDGDYVIEPVPGKVFPVYCLGMSASYTSNPKEYLSLVNTGGDFNFSEWGSLNHGNAALLRTSFTKVRIDPSSLLVDIGDLTYATTTGTTWGWGAGVTSMAFGVAGDCTSGYQMTGLANIDLTGTLFAVQTTYIACMASGAYVEFDGQTVSLSAAGGAPYFDQPVVVSTKAVTVHGGGSGECGGAGPYGFRSTSLNQ